MTAAISPTGANLLLQATNPAQSKTAAGSLGSGAASIGDSAQISAPAQLYAELQQLQTQNPAEFNQVVTNIANQLQTAAQQAGNTPQGQFLSNLASQFQNVANGGDLSQLQPKPQGHHHHHTYDQNGQLQSSSASAASQTTSNGSASLQQLFTSIQNEVTQALAS